MRSMRRQSIPSLESRVLPEPGELVDELERLLTLHRLIAERNAEIEGSAQSLHGKASQALSEMDNDESAVPAADDSVGTE